MQFIKKCLHIKVFVSFLSISGNNYLFAGQQQNVPLLHSNHRQQNEWKAERLQTAGKTPPVRCCFWLLHYGRHPRPTARARTRTRTLNPIDYSFKSSTACDLCSFLMPLSNAVFIAYKNKTRCLEFRKTDL